MSHEDYLSDKELNFVRLFVCELKRQGLIEISYDSIHERLRNSAKVLITRDKIKDIAKYDIHNIFSINPITGKYDRFIDALIYISYQFFNWENNKKLFIIISLDFASTYIDIIEDKTLKKYARQAAEQFINAPFNIKETNE